jgi:hypothetical protein
MSSPCAERALPAAALERAEALAAAAAEEGDTAKVAAAAAGTSHEALKTQAR